MAPWSPPRERRHYVWVPEGSCFPPSYLKRYLRERHGLLDTLLPPTSGNSRLFAASDSSEHLESPSRSHPLRRCASYNIHRTHAPNHPPAYISIPFPPDRPCMKQRRWSLGVPPSYISSEFITRHLNSQRVDANMRTTSTQSDASNGVPSLPLPAIKVSTSTTTIAISFPGSPEGPTLAPEPLAIRRGQKMLTPLTLHAPQRADEEYPGIPTAFLGTPSAYAPHFQFASSTAQTDARSLAISDMISTLRSQVADLKPSSPVEHSLVLLDIPQSSANSLSAVSSVITPSVSEDDWAFANDLMLRYGDHAHSRIPTKEKYSQQEAPFTSKPPAPKTRPATQQSRARRASVPPASSTPKNRPKSSSAPRTDLAKPRHSMTVARQSRASRQMIPRNGGTKHAPRPTSSPSPSLGSTSSLAPSHAAALTFDSLTTSSNSKKESLTKRPPGILKHVKSVRFATDMPKRDEAKNDGPLVNQHRVSISNGSSPSLQPSPLRACFVPGEPEVQTPSRQPRTGQLTESPRVLVVDRRGSVQTPSQTVNLRSPNTPTFPGAPGLSDNQTPSSGNSQRMAKTLSLLVREHDKDKGKENSPLSFRTQKRTRRNTGGDENAARRASPGESGRRKHRLSSPLKSFLERLRA
jgi:hypothetical protein